MLAIVVHKRVQRRVDARKHFESIDDGGRLHIAASTKLSRTEPKLSRFLQAKMPPVRLELSVVRKIGYVKLFYFLYYLFFSSPTNTTNEKGRWNARVVPRCEWQRYVQ